MSVTVSVQVAKCPECGGEAVLPLLDGFPHFKGCSRLSNVRVRSYADFLPKTSGPKDDENPDIARPGEWEHS